MRKAGRNSQERAGSMSARRAVSIVVFRFAALRSHVVFGAYKRVIADLPEFVHRRNKAGVVHCTSCGDQVHSKNILRAAGEHSAATVQPGHHFLEDLGSSAAVESFTAPQQPHVACFCIERQ
jgi:hypothetical protein